MITVELKELRFQGLHGLYEGENIVGNQFEVSLEVTCENDIESDFLLITDTLDYTQLYNIIKIQMQKPVALLEKLAFDILNDCKAIYPQIKFATISIYKLQPPIEHFQGKVGVTLQKTFDE